MAGTSGDDGVSVLVGGVMTLETDPQVIAQFSGQTLTPTADFTFPWNGALVSFRANDTIVIGADLLAALTTAGAPFTQP
jgi:hypothetical protein